MREPENSMVGGSFAGNGQQARILLVEANDVRRWVGGKIPFEVHIPPIGLMYLAGYARSRFPEAEIQIVESSLHCRADDDYVKLVRDFNPSIVGIRSITFFLEELQRIALLTRENSDALLVAGGPIVSAYRNRLFSSVPELDIAVKGEGEQTLARVIAGESLDHIEGIFYRSSTAVMENADAPEIVDLDTVPFPAYDLIDLDLYRNQLSYAYNHRRQGILLTSRGCVYNCTFCFNQWGGMRLRSPENVFREIKQLHDEHDIGDFYIVDDIFNVNSKRASALFKMIVSSGLKIRLYFANGLRTDITSEDFVDEAVEAGAIWFTYAIESACEDIQELINKKVNLEKARKIIGYTQRKGVVVNVSTMFGFPTETREQAHMTLDWLGTLDKPSLLPYHFCLRCFPGCKIASQAQDAGWDPRLIEFGSEMSYNDLPLGTPTLPRSDMLKLLLEYHSRFGLNNQSALNGAVHTLRTVGYDDEEIVHMYSVLKRKMIGGVGEVICETGCTVPTKSPSPP
jgi:radical SAM superfamily enzyme YgiQ (UPF0313 family)